MSVTDLIDRYFKAWNAHDASALAALFARRDAYAYEDPTSRIAVRADDLDTVVDAVAAVFPDFQYRITSRTIEGNRAAVEWILSGTNTGPLKPGVTATNKPVHLAGLDILEAGSLDGFTRVRRHFDQKSMYEQIGMQVIVEPLSQDGAMYGYSKRVASGNLNMPAVLGLTWIRYRDQSELDRIRAHAAEIIRDFREEPGFISIVTGAAGNRAFTVTAWEHENALNRALARGHQRAKHEFRTTDLSPGVWTSIWKPHRINRLWSKCPACGQPNDASGDHRDCSNCSATLEQRQPYW